ncbi:MAG: hypothetical protein OXP69_09940, partial [Spirochaetaceae bacterium]|nr:hypothetical protein [Spirochaetaceae bacterium]
LNRVYFPLIPSHSPRTADLRLDFDLAGMRFLGFRCNERDLDVAGIEPMRLPAMPNLWSMLNVVFFVESDAATRAFLYLDSVAVSTST